MTIETIDRTKLLRLIDSTKGKFFTVDFTRKDGTLRTMTCRLGSTSKLKGGINKTDIVVYAAIKMEYRTLNLNTIFRVRAGGTYYRVEGLS